LQMASRSKISQRTQRLYDAIFSIFELNENEPNANWEYLKHHMRAAQVRALYIAISEIWPRAYTLSQLLPPIQENLRSYYVGRPMPENVGKLMASNALYSDEIVVTSPFLNPLNVVEEINPIVHPEKHMSETFQNLGFIIELYPWHKAGKLILIPNPIHYAHEMFEYVFNPDRVKGLKDTRDKRLTEGTELLEDYARDQMSSTLLRMPSRFIEPYIRQNFADKPKDEQDSIIWAFKYLKEKDRFILDSPELPNGEFHISSVGAPYDAAILLGRKTGSYIYTDHQFQWNQILNVIQADDSTEKWSPITKAFQELNFKFLNNIPPDLAMEVASENRMALFRSFMSDLWAEAALDTDSSSNRIREFRDQLYIAHAEAEKDWDDIDKKLGRKFSKDTVAAMAAMLTGKLSIMVPLGHVVLSSSLNLYLSHKDRKSFKATNPMAMLVDLKAKNS
jgi:hypothetical protein